MLINFVIYSLTIYIVSRVIPGVTIDTFWTAMFITFLLSMINITIKPIIHILVLPINMITLGLFSLIVNAGIIYFLSTVIKGFTISSFVQAIYFSLIVTVITIILNLFRGKN